MVLHQRLNTEKKADLEFLQWESKIIRQKLTVVSFLKKYWLINR